MKISPEARPFEVKVGKEIVLYPVGNFNRRCEMICFPAVVESVARKYFTARRTDVVDWSGQFSKKYCVSKEYVDMGQGWFAYESKDALINEYDRARKWAAIRMYAEHHYSYRTIPETVLRKIYSAIPADDIARFEARIEN